MFVFCLHFYYFIIFRFFYPKPLIRYRGLKKVVILQNLVKSTFVHMFAGYHGFAYKGKIFFIFYIIKF